MQSHPDSTPEPTSARSGMAESADGIPFPSFPSLTAQAFQLRSQGRYALHPIETAFHHHRATTEGLGEEGDRDLGFAEAEGHYRAGAQGLRLSEIPQLPQQLREMSRLGVVDRASRKALWTSPQSRTGRNFLPISFDGPAYRRLTFPSRPAGPLLSFGRVMLTSAGVSFSGDGTNDRRESRP